MSIENISNMEGDDDHVQNDFKESLVDKVISDIGVQKSYDEESTNN